MFQRVLMNRKKTFPTLTKPVMLVSGLALLIPVSSCAVFSIRASRWEQNVTRDPDGVLSHARARTWPGDGPSMLLVHGFGDGPHVWNKLGPALADNGFHVRAMRLPGLNEPMEVKRSVTREDWRTQVLIEMSALETREQPVVVMAHSLGACVVSDLVQGGQLQPDALVLYAPLFKVSDERSPGVSSRTWFNIGQRVLPDSFIVESIFDEQAARGTARPKTERDPYNPKNIFAQMFALMDERAAKPVQAPSPVLMVVTDQDKVIHTPVALSWFEDLQAPAKTLRTESDAGHAMPLDLETRAETQKLVHWLDTQGITP
jgi:alpha-beta hydrolase superfamily lysophospholipase